MASGSFASWLFRIAHNAGIDYNKQIRRSDNYKIEAHSVQPDFYEETELEKNERYATLSNAMTHLKEEEREVLILGKIDCLRYREIADILGTTESNVKIKIFRALSRLKAIYEKLENSNYEKARSKGKVI